MPYPDSSTVHSVVVQPEDGVGPVKRLVDAATRSLRVKQFTFTDPDMLAALLAAHERGVSVRVMMNPQRSSGSRANDETFATLVQAGVDVRWTHPDFAVTHEKSLAIDDEVAVVATFNMCTKYFTLTRDYGIVTRDAVQVAQIIACFEADWTRDRFEPDEHCGLLWSNDNSRRLMAHFFDAAQETLEIQHPKFVDATIVERIASARRRGVRVHLLCGGKHGISDWDILDTFASLRILAELGVKVKRQKHLKLHAKLVVADDRWALVGSMNIDRSAFDLRRELGISLDEPRVVRQLQSYFHHDWKLAKHYDAPDPLDPERHDDGELPHDPGFLHE